LLPISWAVMFEDWTHDHRVLVGSSKAVLLRFYERHPKDSVIAIGYVFELRNVSPRFDLCANVGECHDEREEVRWNSGDYTFPAGLLGSVHELGSAWTQINDHLHEAAQEEEEDGEIYRGLVAISCRSLVGLARLGLLGNSARLDFNVSEVYDPLAVVIARNRAIHAQLTAKN